MLEKGTNLNVRLALIERGEAEPLLFLPGRFIMCGNPAVRRLLAVWSFWGGFRSSVFKPQLCATFPSCGSTGFAPSWPPRALHLRNLLLGRNRNPFNPSFGCFLQLLPSGMLQFEQP